MLFDLLDSEEGSKFAEDARTVKVWIDLVHPVLIIIKVSETADILISVLVKLTMDLTFLVLDLFLQICDFLW